MTPCFYVMVGIPGSGKSTWVKNNGIDAVIVSTDDIVMELAEEGETYDDAWAKNIKIAEGIFWSRLKNAILNGKNIIVDRTNLTKKSRKLLLDLLDKESKTEYKKIAVVVGHGISAFEWVKRINSREGKNIPTTILFNMVKNFEYPSLTEGFNTIETELNKGKTNE